MLYCYNINNEKTNDTMVKTKPVNKYLFKFLFLRLMKTLF